jgi:hypothetical protein
MSQKIPTGLNALFINRTGKMGLNELATKLLAVRMTSHASSE